MIALALACAGLAAWLWVGPPTDLGRRLDPPEPGSRSRGRRGLRRAALAVLGLAIVGSALAVFGPPGGAVASAAVIAGAAGARLARLGRRARIELATRAEVARACSAIANQVRVGRIPAEALGVAAEDAPVLAAACRVQGAGGDTAAILLEQADQPGCRGLGDLARAWQVGTRTGAPMAGLLDQVARALRADQVVQRTVVAELAGPRATGKVMAVLPLVGIALGYLLGGDPVRFLLAGPLGWTCLVIGAALAAGGVLWIDWLARQVGRTV